jgi:hypothetical protein
MAIIKWILTPPHGVAIRPSVTPGYTTPNAISVEFSEHDVDSVLSWLKMTHEYYDTFKNGAGDAADVWKARAAAALNQSSSGPSVPPEIAILEQPRHAPTSVPPEQRLAGQSAAARTNSALQISGTSPSEESPVGMAQAIIEGHPPTTPPPAIEEHYNPLLDGCPTCRALLTFTFFNGAMAIKCNTPGCAGIPTGIIPLDSSDLPEDGQAP